MLVLSPPLHGVCASPDGEQCFTNSLGIGCVFVGLPEESCLIGWAVLEEVSDGHEELASKKTPIFCNPNEVYLARNSPTRPPCARIAIPPPSPAPRPIGLVG